MTQCSLEKVLAGSYFGLLSHYYPDPEVGMQMLQGPALPQELYSRLSFCSQCRGSQQCGHPGAVHDTAKKQNGQACSTAHRHPHQQQPFEGSQAPSHSGIPGAFNHTPFAVRSSLPLP